MSLAVAIPNAWHPFKVNEGILDYWTASHAFWGFVAGFYGLRLEPTLLLGFLWEAFEMWAKDNEWPAPWPHPTQDTVLHIAFDTFAMAYAWKAGEYFRRAA